MSESYDYNIEVFIPMEIDLIYFLTLVLIIILVGDRRKPLQSETFGSLGSEGYS
jgi:hypothetical protein